MYFSSVLCLVFTFTLSSPFGHLASARVITPGSDARSDRSLRPIHVDDYERATGLHVRAVNDLSRLALRQQAHLPFGTENEDSKLHIANFTLYAPDGMSIIMMEQFEDFTSAVDCQGEDKLLSLTFKTRSAFDFAMSDWTKINDDNEKSFILVTNHEGCGPDLQRQAYIITQVTPDESFLRSNLVAEAAPWKQVAGTFDVNIGTLKPNTEPPALASANQSSVAQQVNASKQIVARGFWSSVYNGAANVYNGAVKTVQNVGSALGVGANALQGTGDVTKSRRFSIDVGEAGNRIPLYDYEDEQFAVKLACVECYIQGEVEFTGRERKLTEGRDKFKNFKPETLTLDIGFIDLVASLQVEAQIRGSKHGSYSKQQTSKGSASFSTDSTVPKDGITDSELQDGRTTVVSRPIPDAGVSVQGFLDLGFIMDFDVAAGASGDGVGTLILGLETTFGGGSGINDGATLTIDMLNPLDSEQSGFQGKENVHFKPVARAKNIDGRLVMHGTAIPKLALKLEIFDYELSSYVEINAPKWASVVEESHAEDPKGACSGDGLSVSTQAGMELDFGLNVPWQKHAANWKLVVSNPPSFLSLSPP
ncbi:MAG: hypothetical protein M1825_003943 [Sarcosagium campestre]|nr:MAG: hypothetical protein M1825_003943 [Sarcosagium campestre]